MRSPQTTSRIHAIDWLRVLAVLAIFFGHVAYKFGISTEASIRNAETSLAVSVYGGFIDQWAVPLLFLLAEASSWCSLQSRASCAFLGERVRRLLVPLLFGSVVLIPWIAYMSALNQGNFEGSYWQFVPIHFARTSASLQALQHHHGPIALYYTSWHLWFLGYLLLFSVLSLASHLAWCKYIVHTGEGWPSHSSGSPRRHGRTSGSTACRLSKPNQCSTTFTLD